MKHKKIYNRSGILSPQSMFILALCGLLGVCFGSISFLGGYAGTVAGLVVGLAVLVVYKNIQHTALLKEENNKEFKELIDPYGQSVFLLPPNNHEVRHENIHPQPPSAILHPKSRTNINQ